MFYIGIDPGASGGIAVITPSKTVVVAMPPTERDIWVFISKIVYRSDGECVAVIENVHSMPGQGVSSSFKFGQGFGGLRMALTAVGIPFDLVSPQKWQKTLGVVPRTRTETKTSHKNKLKAMAQRQFPQLKITLKTADALLIALYCKRTRENALK